MLSVIIPVYNIEDYLPECLDSVLQQSYRDIEVILVDDGSTDKSGAICDQYAGTDSRVKVFHIENGGVSAARNLGKSKATGEWLTFVDADDRIPQDTFMICISTAETERVDMVMSRMCFELNPEGTELLIPKMQHATYCSESTEKYVRNAIRNFKMSFWGKIYSKSLLQDIHFPEGIPNYEDYIALWEIALKHPAYSLVNHVGYVARCRPGSASRSRNGLQTYRKRMTSLIYACKKMEELFERSLSIRKDLTKFIIIEGLACKELYALFDETDSDEVKSLTCKVWETMLRSCIMPGYMRMLLSWRVDTVKGNINRYPWWQYAAIRLALRLM